MEPNFDLTPQSIWNYFQNIASDPRHPARILTLANIDLQGQPQARSVILREADPWLLSIYTDSRSPKVSQLANDPNAQLLFWDQQKRWQLRCSASAQLVTDESTLAELWRKIGSSASAQDYLGAQPPGELLQSGLDSRTEPALAILRFHVTEIDWLALDRAGHKRQRLTPDGVQALVP